MADGNYARLRLGGLGFARLVVQGKRGGARPNSGGRRIGAGRPRKTEAPKPQELTTKACLACSAMFPALRNRRYCGECSSNRRALKEYTGCTHEKPRFANGKERRFCFECSPKADPKPRKVIEFKLAVPAVCAAISCGASFTKKMGREKYCSDRCRLRANARTTQAKKRNNLPRACGCCGTEFVPPYGSFLKLYCSDECGEKMRRKLKSGSSHRRRAERYGCEFTAVNKRKVFERDGWRCYLCGRHTPPEKSGTTEPDAPELEHVVPLSKGGAHTYENVRCSCRRCNREKGTSILDAPGGGIASLQPSASTPSLPFLLLIVDKKGKRALT